MMAVLPTSPPVFDPGNLAGSVKALCNYVIALQENLNYVLGQLQKSINALENGGKD